MEETEILEHYQFEECEYSAQVRLKMSEWEVDSILRNVSRGQIKAAALKEHLRRSEPRGWLTRLGT